MSRAEAVQAINRRARKQAERAISTRRANVLSVNPLKLDLLSGGGILTEDDFEMTQWVKFYDREFGIDKGDTVTVQRDRGDWTITDVISERDLSEKTLQEAS